MSPHSQILSIFLLTLIIVCSVLAGNGWSQTFTDVTTQAGLLQENKGWGAAWGDFDNDGQLDLYIARQEENRLYRNTGGTLADWTIGAANVGGEGRGVAFGDYDRNNLGLDLYLSHDQESNILFQYDGKGGFNISHRAADSGPGHGVAWGDFDNDGDIDLFVANSDGRPNLLYRNDSVSSFVNIADQVGVADSLSTQGAAWGDFDNDGDLDLYTTNTDGPNRLYRNNGSGVFTEIADAAGVDDNGTGRGVAWADYDNDGDIDLYVANEGGSNRLYRNNGNGTFTDIAASAGVDDNGNSRGVAWADYDNDGDIDIYVANGDGPNRLYRNDGNGAFTDTAAAAGVDDNGDSRGTTWGDYDNDGDLDLLVTNGSSPYRLYRNDGNGNNWLNITLVGTLTNWSGIGTRVLAATGSQTQRRDVDGGSGYLSQPSLQVEFGFSNTTVIDSLIIFWTTGHRQVIKDVQTNQHITVTEPENGFDFLFTDVAVTAGLDNGQNNQGVAWGDYDGDGDLDLFRTTGTGAANQLYRNNGDGSFTDVAGAAGVNDDGDGRGVAWADYDNDGDLDIYVVNYAGLGRLYRNNGDGSFTDVAGAAGVDITLAGRAVAWGDYDNDGLVDLYVTNESQSDRLFRNNGDGSFTDKTLAAGILDGFDKRGAAWGDYDNDGDLDIYVANGGDLNGSPNQLYRNNGDGTFTEIAGQAGVQGDRVSIAVAWADYDNDGDLDIFVSNIPPPSTPGDPSHLAPNYLYQNNGDGTFSDVAEAAGVAEGLSAYEAVWADYDNDGDLDLYLATSANRDNRLYRNNGIGVFTNADNITGVTRGHTEATLGDYDNDGDLDIYVNGQSSVANLLYRNSGLGNRWLVLNLEGTISNRNGIGTRIIAVSGTSRQLRDVNGGSGYLSQPSLPVEFGAGNADVVDSLIIQWPSGLLQIQTQVTTNQHLTISETGTPVDTMAPSTPDTVQATATDRRVTVQWTPNPDTDLSYYIVYRDTISGFRPTRQDSIATIQPPATSFTDTTVMNSITYYYRVTAVDSSGNESDFSAPVSATPNPSTAVTLAGFATEQRGGAVTLTWQTSFTHDHAGFHILRSATTGGSFQQINEQLLLPDRDGVYVYRDQDVEINRTYTYRLQAVEATGFVEIVGALTLTVLPPRTFSLEQNFPNPFNPTTTIRYQLPHPSDVRITVYNTLGQVVRRLIDSRQPAGFYTVRWDGRNMRERQVASGLYLYLIEAGTFSDIRKMLLVK